jgi:predicted nucleotide-binding protein
MTYEEIGEKLEASSYEITEEKEIQHGKSIRLNNGGIINWYKTGKYAVQGKEQEKIKAILEGTKKPVKKKVFVVYGHDEIARTQLEALLRRWDLEPVILDQKASGGQTIIEKLEEYSTDVGYAVILATPDDIGHDKEETSPIEKFRVRQNVVLELGMFLAKLGRKKVAILLKEEENFEKPSDIQGLIYIPFQKKVDEASVSLIRELSRQGYYIDPSKI